MLLLSTSQHSMCADAPLSDTVFDMHLQQWLSLHALLPRIADACQITTMSAEVVAWQTHSHMHAAISTLTIVVLLQTKPLVM